MSLLLDIFLPTKCLFCNRLESRICPKCSYDLGSDPRLVYRLGQIGFATMPYNEKARILLRSYKELGESELASSMATAMIPLIQCFENIPTVLVPVPSNPSSMRERGFNPAELLAREIAKRVPEVRWVNVLSRVRETSDQSKLNPSERAKNQLGSMLARSGNSRVLLVDDVVTTGATIKEATRTLEKAGYFVEGFITFAETEGKRCTLTTQAKLPADGGTSWN